MRLPDSLQPGRVSPLGSSLQTHGETAGVNFAVFSEHAVRVEVCVFDAAGQRELRRLALHGPDDGIWHGFLPGAQAGLVYGLRAHGPYAPEQGHRFNANKLLLDPHAREIVGHFGWRAEHHGYVLGDPEGPRSFDVRDNALHALKARVAAPLAGPDPRANAPHHAVESLVIYEAHVKGFTRRLAAVPESLRGTYAGLGHPAAVAHLKRLGVNAIELLPIHYTVDEPHLTDKGLPNYWGYNSLGFFCPDPRWARAKDPTRIRDEFRAMVQALHAAGIEVLLDVVYNHTPEGNEFGPTLHLRGLDNRSHYHLHPDDASHNENWTGCGNTLNCAHPRVTQLVLDSLRCWVQEYGVDGFRFDLAPVLGRTRGGYSSQAAFFTALRQDPVLAGVHLIAEPWDAGPGGYQVGHFPGRFLEWNDKYRDAARGYWLAPWVGGGVSRGEFARRLAGSSDVFHHGGRQPTASVNFVTCHDGFTLWDLLSHSRKHNHANGEDNRDGRDNELCANLGVEGPTADPAVTLTRQRVQRALLATLAFSQGTPMLNAGDELGHSQGGNNNAYCQDNGTTWLDWTQADTQLLDFVTRCFALRAKHPLLRHPRWFAGPGSGLAHVHWLRPDGGEMQPCDWQVGGEAAFACALHDGPAPQQRLLLLFNPETGPRRFALPAGPWTCLLDSDPTTARPEAPCSGAVELAPHTLLLLKA
ncbi:glycogen debranching protein GlgX [Inhella gelatinilytica]|uniref:Glycogen debranching protein GlgX n=1 Tax=Inhella gelatinilytica TaxID=2795030 RepID=A0A931ISB2_9BURK|nr:glycogen debranching protein GlgX [Inhella gelatinilytica]MBH9551767.1 glycogen debranching protein GlgX [Inhella gelatinilytica]